MVHASELLHLTSTVGVGGAPTFTVTDEQFTLPPGPVHDRLYVCPVVSGPFDSDPEAAFVPDHEPLAVHVVASVTDQDSTVVPL